MNFILKLIKKEIKKAVPKEAKSIAFALKDDKLGRIYFTYTLNGEVKKAFIQYKVELEKVN